jgi:hypothetical protein
MKWLGEEDAEIISHRKQWEHVEDKIMVKIYF